MAGLKECPQCGATVAGDAAWCGRCGYTSGPALGQMSLPAGTGNRPRVWWSGLSRHGKIWTGIAVVAAVLAVAAIGGSPDAGSGPSGPPATAASGEMAAAAPSSTATPASASTASAVPSDVDTDDESVASAGASFIPTATGVPAPVSGGSSTARLPGEPEPDLTPGALNPAVTQATIYSTICVSGWTATIRPPESFTNALKVQQIGQYGYADTSTALYEEDHLISLELGGAPADARNLWPEPYTDSLSDGRPVGAHIKDSFETKLKDEVCAGSTTLAQAQAEIGDDWVHAYYGIALSTPAATPAPSEPTPTQALPMPQPTARPTAIDSYAAAKAAGATAICADGTWSNSASRSGACSKHGGVHWWTGNVGPAGPGLH